MAREHAWRGHKRRTHGLANAKQRRHARAYSAHGCLRLCFTIHPFPVHPSIHPPIGTSFINLTLPSTTDKKKHTAYRTGQRSRHARAERHQRTNDRPSSNARTTPPPPPLSASGQAHGHKPHTARSSLQHLNSIPFPSPISIANQTAHQAPSRTCPAPTNPPVPPGPRPDRSPAIQRHQGGQYPGNTQPARRNARLTNRPASSTS